MSTDQPKLYMICGISGSGKTFYAKKLERQGVVRLSIDEELWPDFFILDPLLCAEHKAMLKEQAKARIKSRAANLIAAGRDVSIDMPFCKRAQRDEFRAFAREHGAAAVFYSVTMGFSSGAGRSKPFQYRRSSSSETGRALGPFFPSLAARRALSSGKSAFR